ncbi:ERF family protein [Pseudomonas aeruginosa]|uniref:ERF family protein n=1 Tax=Pseudomonas aeruginosa TaxID=287 RepID=UPI00136621F9|nr:ERF family protein [Pseudomonas aeruginosa]EJV1365150.1 ERF family protein [Pseudomonas aeruginosa]EJV1382264.1 ERF family protein [Pseudomonas aeruginosa]EJV1605517.1 ERF family protein [Pseudomonas aeruginosa]EKD1565842.1 ERF family protein [Pseudomonas aeruginosa]EKJ6944985.1 ERF family protein [Pseudomonas aeruginosa]
MQTSLKPMADSNTPIAIQESATVLQVIQKAASDPSCDIEKLERLMAMHERMQAKQAEQQYTEALAAMQQELPAIAERGDANGRYSYALWEDINERLKPILAKHGFALTFRTPRNEKGVEVEGVLSHRGGHSERTSMLLPADTSGNKNAVQAVASSVSYGKRYTAGALLNYTTHGEDDDAFSAVSQQPALDQRVVIDILERIDEAKDKDELAAIWKAAVGVLRAAGDTTGYERVKAAAAERGKALEGTEK